MSLKNVRLALDAGDVPCHVMTQIHEEGGPYLGDTVEAGLKRSEVEACIPEIKIDEDQAKILTEDGWFKQSHKETQD